MKITAIALARLRVPLKTPFKTALRTVTEVDDIVVLIRTDSGHTGHGSAAATAVITGDTHGSIIAAITHHIAPRLVGRHISDFNHLTQQVQHALVRNSSAKAAVDIALHDLWAQLHGVPLYRMLGGSQRNTALATDITISVDAIDTMVAHALAAVAHGYAALKIKVGTDTALDVQRVLAIHAAVQGRATLRIDANQGWRPKQAVAAMRQLEHAGVPMELLEQPMRAHDIDGLKFVTERIETPVMADESVFDPAQAMDVLQRRAADILNIKLMKAGGIARALRIADIADAFGVPCMIGCMIESSIGVAAAAHVAVARAAVITKIDLDAPALCSSDPVDGGTRFDGPRIAVGDAPGLGIRAINGLQHISPGPET